MRIFGPSRPLKPRFSLERVVVFEVFTIFSSQSLFAVSWAAGGADAMDAAATKKFRQAVIDDVVARYLATLGRPRRIQNVL